MNTFVKEVFSTNHGFLETRDIRTRSGWRELRKLQNNNTIVKIKKGLYRLDNVVCDQMVEVARMIPDGVFCLFTAWQYYNLSVYNPFEFYVAIRKKQKRILPAYPPVKLSYWIDKFYVLGITEIIVDNHPVKMYDLEKSVCDAVRFRNKVGLDIAFEVVKNYVRRKDRNFTKLSNYARPLRIEKIMQNMIMPML